MKKIITLSVLAMTMFSAFAGTKWSLQGTTHTVDTLYHAKVGPGTTQTSLKVSGSSNLRVFYTTTDLSNPYVEMRVSKANNLIKSMRSVSGQSKDNSVEGAQYFVGVNADFFDMSTGTPIGTNILNSELYNNATDTKWTEISFDDNKTPHIGKLTFSGSVKKSNGQSYNVSAINASRSTNFLVIYSSRFGKSTDTNEFGSEVIATPVESGATIALGKTVKMKITGAVSNDGNMSIPEGAYVLSGHGNAKYFVAGLADGDEVEITLSASLNGAEIKPTWAVGGCPAILKNGEVLETEDANIISHLPSKEPRTAVGYDKTGTKVVMLIVDGRSDISDGCRTKILADIMREVGCSDAMNFDGGASSELYHQKLGILNVPSGGMERSVTNSLFAVATTPTDNNIAEIRFVDWVKEMPKYGFYTPKFYGYNKYGVLVNTDLRGVTLSCSSELGEIVENGSTLYGNGGGSHLLTATYNGLSTNIVMTVDDTQEPVFRHERVLLDSYKDYKVDIYGVIRNQEIAIENKAFEWTSSNESVATVDENGVVKGLKNGKATITGTVGEFSKSIAVDVEIPLSRYKDLDANSWNLSVSNIENSKLSAIEDGCFAVDYTTTSSRKVYITLTKNLLTWSRPDSLVLEINPGDASWKSISVFFANIRKGNEVVEYNFDVNFSANTLNRFSIPMSGIIDLEDMSNYPLVFNKIYVVVSDKTGTTHHVEFKRMAWVYNSIPGGNSGVETVVKSANDLQISPNPVNSGEVVKLNVNAPVEYSVFSINGSLIKTGNGEEISTVGMSAGIYVVSVIQNGKKQVARLIVK